jgi:hypothetical protein
LKLWTSSAPSPLAVPGPGTELAGVEPAVICRHASISGTYQTRPSANKNARDRKKLESTRSLINTFSFRDTIRVASAFSFFHFLFRFVCRTFKPSRSERICGIRSCEDWLAADVTESLSISNSRIARSISSKISGFEISPIFNLDAATSTKSMAVQQKGACQKHLNKVLLPRDGAGHVHKKGEKMAPLSGR